MNDPVHFLIQNSYFLLFAWVLIGQMGLPIPAVPLLLVSGALARAGEMNLSFVMTYALTAIILADVFWYYLGRYRGSRILKLVCRISLEPDSCVRRTENVFLRHGRESLLLAKFVPGLNIAAPALAGIFRMPMLRFVLFDFLGGFFWILTFAGLGLTFSNQLEQIITYSYSLWWEGWLVVVLVAMFAGHILWKYIQRRHFLRRLHGCPIPRQSIDAHNEERKEVKF